MPILRDIESLCPGALLLNFTNPVPRMCIAAARFSKVRCVGICHGIATAYLIAGVVLSRDLDIEVPPGFLIRWGDTWRIAEEITRDAMEKVDIVAAGLNHFTWVLSLRDRKTGEDLYPLFRDRERTHDPAFEPLTRELLHTFGLFPATGDCHICEYLPYTHNMDRDTWDAYAIQMYPLDLAERNRDQTWGEIEQMADGSRSIDRLRSVTSERAEAVIAAMKANLHCYELALNLPNRGYIPNLPDGAIVEVPSIVSTDGPSGIGVGPLPEPIAELCRRQITVAELAVAASVAGDRQLALQSLALDPMIDDPRVARSLLDDYLREQRDYVPQFQAPASR